MKKVFNLFSLVIFALFVFVGCENSDSTKGTLTLSITDAPIDMSNVTGVYLTVTEIQINKSGSNWITLEEFEGPQTFNILELTNGESALMGNFSFEAGNYTQLRFILDAPELTDGNPSNPGCYITFSDAPDQPLFVPSGGQSGWKAIGAFKVPSNGDVAITADFDARKSIMKQGANDFYILKPTIRLIVDGQAGKIVGNVTNIPEGVDIIIYAYENNIYTEAEAVEPVNDTTALFPNAVTSAKTDSLDHYCLAFLAPMTYDLVVATSVDGEFQEVLGIVEDVVVESRITTSQPIDISTL
ncbi:MAG: hypothetical protein A2X13_04775 [Bacteroidetes bacterium GWC2_33_15]|nr:MAG: hypothetical protein A2X10_06620 [Bacteroidetes bacterium GWA2_33_15]OFX49838.1 MAG: hypothetical protein A2X13_04775 [Bacteroidetes bacterium GWC2_33_15]OFX65029.1 MAG: hypothetical protein A2X15_06695 [Bacteroidetes bacterium GWB2_32_14]OFX69009.1 MAG: hypothetical protein A2X14_13460 [Bacteroidetes bacterium GWD2_33_33]HAN18275.1 hypothetical protein [Bacteroidales bacterium]